MKFNITRDDAEFYINPEKGVVVCTLTGTSNLFKRFVLENFRIMYDCDEDYNCVRRINGGRSLLEEKMEMPDKFTGIARLGTGDKWNEDIGCTIAFSRAKDNLLKSFWKRMNTYLNTVGKWLDDAIDIAHDLGEKFEANTRKRHEYINDLLGAE